MTSEAQFQPIFDLSQALYDFKDAAITPAVPQGDVSAKKALVLQRFKEALEFQGYQPLAKDFQGMRSTFESMPLDITCWSDLMQNVRAAQNKYEEIIKRKKLEKIPIDLRKNTLYRGQSDDIEVSKELLKLPVGSYVIREKGERNFFVSVRIGLEVYHHALPEKLDVAQVEAFVEEYVNIESKLFVLPELKSYKEADALLKANVGTYYVAYSNDQTMPNSEKELRLYFFDKTLKFVKLIPEKMRSATPLPTKKPNINALLEEHLKKLNLNCPILSIAKVRKSSYCHAISPEKAFGFLKDENDCLFSLFDDKFEMYYFDNKEKKFVSKEIRFLFINLPPNVKLIFCQDSNKFSEPTRKSLLDQDDEKGSLAAAEQTQESFPAYVLTKDDLFTLRLRFMEPINSLVAQLNTFEDQLKISHTLPEDHRTVQQQVIAAFDLVLKTEGYEEIKEEIQVVKKKFESEDLKTSLLNLKEDVRRAQRKLEAKVLNDTETFINYELRRSSLFRGTAKDDSIYDQLIKLSEGSFFIRETSEKAFFITVRIGNYMHHLNLKEEKFDIYMDIISQVKTHVKNYVNVGSKFFLLPVLESYQAAENLLKANAGSYYLAYYSIYPGSPEAEKELRLYYHENKSVKYVTIGSERSKSSSIPALHTKLTDNSLMIETYIKDLKLTRPIFSPSKLAKTSYCHNNDLVKVSDHLTKTGDCLLKGPTLIKGQVLYYRKADETVAHTDCEASFEILPENGIMIPCQDSLSIQRHTNEMSPRVRKASREAAEIKSLPGYSLRRKPSGEIPKQLARKPSGEIPQSPKLLQAPEGGKLLRTPSRDLGPGRYVPVLPPLPSK